jgi:hypothetical protein
MILLFEIGRKADIKWIKGGWREGILMIASFCFVKYKDAGYNKFVN